MFVDICIPCGKGFKSRMGYNNHMKMYHTKEGEVQTYKCEVCGKSCATRKPKSQGGTTTILPKPNFIQDHLGNFGFVCPKCGKMLKTKSGYRLHYKLNHGEKTKLPACEVCEPLSAPMESLRPTRSLSWRGSGPSVGRTSKGFSFLDTETCQVIAGIAHRLIQNPGGIKRVCAHCKRLGSKFACGMFRRSYYRCDACNVSLCRPNFKDCFYQWHHQLAKLTLEK
uniref:C2H2-type domain-containing protein n=1 Tax=Magallana gigas TaxID=29159 RepID=A0A8W8N227_MAGGI